MDTDADDLELLIETEEIQNVDDPHLPIHKETEFERVKEPLPQGGRPPILRRDPSTSPHLRAKPKAAAKTAASPKASSSGRIPFRGWDDHIPPLLTTPAKKDVKDKKEKDKKDAKDKKKDSKKKARERSKSRIQPRTPPLVLRDRSGAVHRRRQLQWLLR